MTTFTLTGPILAPDGSTPRPNFRVVVTPKTPLPGLSGAILNGVPTLTDAAGDFSLDIEVVDGAVWDLRVETPAGDLLYRKAFVSPPSGTIAVADIIAEDYASTLTPSQYSLLAAALGGKADQPTSTPRRHRRRS